MTWHLFLPPCGLTVIPVVSLTVLLTARLVLLMGLAGDDGIPLSGDGTSLIFLSQYSRSCLASFLASFSSSRTRAKSSFTSERLEDFGSLPIRFGRSSRR